jgi:predicted Rossmann fold flavoprotein
MRPIIIIGAGAAGIIAAWKAASSGAPVVLCERNSKLGIKLLISGGGKCNITHAGPMEDVRNAFLHHEARFLRPSFFRFGNDAIVNMIEAEGVRTYTRPDGRIFPVSGRAGEVVDALAGLLKRTHVDVRLNTRVESISRSGNCVNGVKINTHEIPSSHIVLATGGASYPKTGTTGDGFVWARALGHTVVPIRPALAPISVRPHLPPHWRGVAVRGGSLAAYSNGKKICSWDGDILFTHEGVSGPAALEVSRPAAAALVHHPVSLQFDFLPSKEFAAVDAELNDTIQTQRGKMVGTLLEAWLPNRLIPALLQFINVDPAKRGHVLTREERRAVVRLLKSWEIGAVGSINIERGEVTAGGIGLNEIDPHSMRSRKMRGLYVCGEVLDIAGPVGGYNLQTAFSTGFVAGESAAKDWLADLPSDFSELNLRGTYAER